MVIKQLHSNYFICLVVGGDLHVWLVLNNNNICDHHHNHHRYFVLSSIFPAVGHSTGPEDLLQTLKAFRLDQLSSSIWLSPLNLRLGACCPPITAGLSSMIYINHTHAGLPSQAPVLQENKKKKKRDVFHALSYGKILYYTAQYGVLYSLNSRETQQHWLHFLLILAHPTSLSPFACRIWKKKKKN